jgi:hypothetical protein
MNKIDFILYGKKSGLRNKYNNISNTNIVIFILFFDFQKSF